MPATYEQRAAAMAEPEFVQQVLLLAYGRGWTAPQPQRALALARARPLDSLVLALALGDLPTVQRGLAGVDLARPLPPLGAPPLACAVFSSLARLDECRNGLVATVRWLLQQGADPNGRWQPPDHPDEPLPLLYGAVALMLDLGWPVAVRGDWDASALNQAAFRGDTAMVRLLLAHGARWHEPNGFGGDALGSCLYAGTNLPSPGGDYTGVLRLLLADGAPAPQEVDLWPEAMQQVLGIRPPSS